MTQKEIETLLYAMSESEMEALKHYDALQRYQRISGKQELTESETAFKLQFETSAGFQNLTLNRNGFTETEQLYEEQEGAFHIARQPRYCAEPTHRHAFFEILFVYSGHCECTIEKEAYRMKQGDVCIISLGVRHQIQSLNAEDIVVSFRIKTDLFHHIETANPLLTQFFLPQVKGKKAESRILLHGEANEQLWRIFYLIFSEYYRHDLLSFDSTVHGIYLLFNELSRMYLPGENLVVQNRKQELSEELLHYISKFYQTCTLESMSRQFGYSVSYLSSYMKEKTGMHFQEIRQNIRLEAAQKLLEKEEDSVAEIAKNVGYDSENSFYKAFKKKYGMTPGEYRKRNISAVKYACKEQYGVTPGSYREKVQKEESDL